MSRRGVGARSARFQGGPDLARGGTRARRGIGRLAASAFLVLAAAGAACSSGGSAGSPSAGATGGTNGTGGAAKGGSGVAGNGPSSTGGAVATGGVVATGGTAAPGGVGGTTGGSSGGAGGASDPGAGGTAGTVPDAGVPGGPATGDPLTRALAQVANIDSTGLANLYPASFAPGLSYDPTTAKNVDLITSSPLGLSDAETQVLGKNGFVISDRQRFPTFTHGYEAIYAADLPLFVSADSILYAVHRSYDKLLENLESSALRPTLSALLTGMRSALASGAITPLGTDTAADIDLYLAVPLGLLSGTTPAPVAGASATRISTLMMEAKAAIGMDYVDLFGSSILEDFSQFTPRGHYTDSSDLQTYFQAMTWLGRFELTMVDVRSDGTTMLDRRRFDGALGMATLVATGTNQTLWSDIDSLLDAFVGEPDSMPPSQFPALLQALGTTDLASVVALDDATIEAALVAGNFGYQRIASQIVVAGVHDQGMVLPRSFLLLGQRYVIDSHVFSNVTYDRVPPSPTGRMRVLPNPLDVAFAVFGANQAVSLLKSDLDTFAYAPDLGAMRVLADAHGDDFWNENLYNIWLGAARTLGPSGGSQSGPFDLAATEPWSRRLMNTQLASWAELRHDNILYVKQSYSSGEMCSYPDALVEPNPAFFERVAAFASKGMAVLAGSSFSAATSPPYNATIMKYFTNLASAATTLQAMAEAQATGTPFTDDQMTFINQAVKIQSTCGQTYGVGWYPQMFYGGTEATPYPTIADVHTAPTDEQGNPVGWVLHVGTGNARMMVVTANTCDGPKAYVGLASSYFEDLTTGLKRLDDGTWATMLTASPPPADVAWMSDLVVH